VKNGVIMVSWNHNLIMYLEKLNAVLLLKKIKLNKFSVTSLLGNVLDYILRFLRWMLLHYTLLLKHQLIKEIKVNCSCVLK